MSLSVSDNLDKGTRTYIGWYLHCKYNYVKCLGRIFLAELVSIVYRKCLMRYDHASSGRASEIWLLEMMHYILTGTASVVLRSHCKYVYGKAFFLSIFATSRIMDNAVDHAHALQFSVHCTEITWIQFIEMNSTSTCVVNTVTTS